MHRESLQCIYVQVVNAAFQVNVQALLSVNEGKETGSLHA